MSGISAAADTKLVGAYSVENGATVSIKQGFALDYSRMRASQLTGLLEAIAAPGFSDCSETVKADCLWLAVTLSTEVKQLFEVVAADVRQESVQAVGPAQ